MSFDRQRFGLFLGPASFLLLFFLPLQSETLSASAQAMLAVGAWMVIWWICEAVPIAATSLLPIPLYPLLGILDAKAACAPYAHPILFLFMGGFLIALAMQRWGLHERIALVILGFVGTKPSRIFLGFIASTAFLSMWVSNTATTLLMLPIAMSVLASLKAKNSTFAYSLMLAIAYSASVGGMGTPIGTAPNAIMLGQMKELFPDAPPITFLQWMLAALPFIIVFCTLLWLYMSFRSRNTKVEAVPKSFFTEKLKALGKMSRGETWVTLVASTTAVLWIFRKGLDFGGVRFAGWSDFLPTGALIDDGTVAMSMALLLFVLPVNWKKRVFVMNWEWAAKLPWDVLLLLGGGFALAKGFGATQLNVWLAGHLEFLSGAPVWVLVLGIVFFMSFFTEVTSNTAIASTMIPVLAAASVTLEIHPLLLLIPATFAASCAFMLPVATPPNAIVFGSGEVTIPQMAKTGFFLDLAAVALISILTFLVTVHVFGITLSEMPVWAG